MSQKHLVQEMIEMSRFGKWLGKFEVEVDTNEGKEMFELKPNMGHKQELMAIMQRSKKGMSEKDVKRQLEIFEDVLKMSYPEEDSEAFKNFLLQNDLKFQLALYHAFGWVDKSDLKDIQSDAKKQAFASYQKEQD